MFMKTGMVFGQLADIVLYLIADSDMVSASSWWN